MKQKRIRSHISNSHTETWNMTNYCPIIYSEIVKSAKARFPPVSKHRHISSIFTVNTLNIVYIYYFREYHYEKDQYSIMMLSRVPLFRSFTCYTRLLNE